MSRSRPLRRPVHVSWLLAVLPLVAGCAADPPPATQQVTSARGVMTVTLPKGLSTVTFRSRDPAGEGMYAFQGDDLRVVAYASTAVIEERVGDNPHRPWYQFQDVLNAVGSGDMFGIGDGCHQVAIRPIEGGVFYGMGFRYEDCHGRWPGEVRLVAIDAERSAAVFVSASAVDLDSAIDLAQATLSGVRVDIDAVPAGVQSDELLPAD